MLFQRKEATAKKTHLFLPCPWHCQREGIEKEPTLLDLIGLADSIRSRWSQNQRYPDPEPWALKITNSTLNFTQKSVQLSKYKFYVGRLRCIPNYLSCCILDFPKLLSGFQEKHDVNGCSSPNCWQRRERRISLLRKCSPILYDNQIGCRIKTLI